MFIMATILHFGKSGLPAKVGATPDMAEKASLRDIYGHHEIVIMSIFHNFCYGHINISLILQSDLSNILFLESECR